MFYDPRRNLFEHLSTFENGIERSKSLAHLASSSTVGDQSIATDIANSSVVIAVGSLDLLCKKILRESTLSYLYGLLEPPKKIRLNIPLTVSRLIVDIAKTSSRDLGVGSDHTLAAAELDRSLGRDNFQGMEAIAGLFRVLGFEKPKTFMPHDIFIPFERSVNELTNYRHEIVHTTAVQFNTYEFAGVDGIFRSEVTDEIAISLTRGAKYLVGHIESHLI